MNILVTKLRMLLAAFAVATLTLTATTACKHLPEPTTAPCVYASQTTFDEKGLYSLEAAYNVAAFAYVEADSNNVLPDSIKAKTKPALIEAYSWLKAARQAKAAGDACSFAEAALRVTGLAADVKLLLGK